MEIFFVYDFWVITTFLKDKRQATNTKPNIRTAKIVICTKGGDVSCKFKYLISKRIESCSLPQIVNHLTLLVFIYSKAD